MNKLTLAALLFTLVVGKVSAERGIAEISYPISLLGTEMVNDEDDAGSGLIVTRAEIIQSAYPESLIQAVAAPVEFKLAGEGFPKESNLIVLCGITLEPAYGEKEHTLVIDATKMSKTEEEVSMKPEQVLKLVVAAIQQTLDQNAEMADENPIRVTYKLPAGMKRGSLPEVVKVKKNKA